MLRDCTGWGRGPGCAARTFFFLILSLAAALPGIAAPATVELVSRIPVRRAPDTTGPEASWTVEGPLLSTDGRFLAFTSPATNLVLGQADINHVSDVFLYDRDTGAVVLVSHTAGSDVTAGDGISSQPALSADGRFVAFISESEDLTPLGEISEWGSDRVYLFERATGAVTLVSRRAGSPETVDGTARSPQISADGSFIAYVSSADDPVSPPAPEGIHVYVYNRESGFTALVTGPQAEYIDSYALSADGRFVAVSSRSDYHFPGRQLLLWDRLTGMIRQIGQSASFLGLSLSADGRFLAFSSGATNLVPGVTDRNDQPDVFLYDGLTGSISLVSRSAEAAYVTDPEGGVDPSLSANGNAVVYYGAKGYSRLPSQAFVFDRLTGTTARVTQPADPGADVESLSVSANGRYVAFASPARDLVPGQSAPLAQSSNVFVLDRATGGMTLVSHAAGSPVRTGNGSSRSPALSADGSWIAFASKAADLVAGLKDPPEETDDIFLWERDLSQTRAVSLHPPGMASRSPAAGARDPAVGGDGRIVSFTSSAADLAPGFEDANRNYDVFLYDGTTRKITLVSRAWGTQAAANSSSLTPRVSRDGNWILYESDATDLIRDQKDEPKTGDVFLYDRIQRKTLLVSHSYRSWNRTARGQSVPRGLSVDGSVVVFESTATDLIPGQEDRNNEEDLFLWDRRSGAVTLISRTPESPVRTGNREVFFSSMSPDGNFVAFTSAASNLVPGDDADRLPDAYLWDRRTGRVEALHPVRGESSRNPIVSADGRRVAFAVTTSRHIDGASQTLVPYSVHLLDRATGRRRVVAAPSRLGWPLGLSGNGRYLLFQSGVAYGIADLYLFDRISGETRLVSDAASREEGSLRISNARLSVDGRYVAFLSRSADLEPKGIDNVVLYDRTTGESTLISRSRTTPGWGGNGFCGGLSLSATGGFVAFTSDASDLTPNDFNGGGDVFLYIPGEQP